MNEIAAQAQAKQAVLAALAFPPLLQAVLQLATLHQMK